MLTATPGDVWIDWSQFLIGKVERKNLVHDNDSSVSRTTSQFLIGKVERTKPRQGIA